MGVEESVDIGVRCSVGLFVLVLASLVASVFVGLFVVVLL